MCSSERGFGFFEFGNLEGNTVNVPGAAISVAHHFYFSMKPDHTPIARQHPMEIERGNFREDLFYRLNVIPFYVPPLRERVEDIGLLANHYLKSFAMAYGRKPKELTAEAYRTLQDYHWPGNVRELKNLMERIVIMNPQANIDARHVPLNPSKRSVFERPIDFFGSLAEVREAAEREYILKKLEETKGNISRTAELLGMERSNLYRKMKALGIASKDAGAAY